MNYRDESDNLRSRVESLERDLEGARAELDKTSEDGCAKRIEELEKKVAEARRLIEQASGEIDQLRGGLKPVSGPERGRSRSTSPAVVGVIALSFAGVGLWLARREQPPPPPICIPVATPVPVAATPVSAAAPGVSTAPPPRTVAPPAMSVTPPPAPAAPVAEPVKVRWNAKVTHVSGRAPSSASACAIEATLRAGAEGLGIEPIVVLCGGTRVYDSEAPLNGMSNRGGWALEDAGDRAGTFRYQLKYDDKGPRSSTRSEVSINTGAGAAAVWSDNAPAFRIELALSALSEPVTRTTPLADNAEVMRRKATASEVSGKAPLRVGAACDLRVTPQAGGEKCLVRLSCGGRMLFGAGQGGLTECALADHRIAHAIDREPTPKDRDPELDLDGEAGTLILADEGASGRWSVNFTLAPSP